jgi:hypothetical protein
MALALRKLQKEAARLHEENLSLLIAKAAEEARKVGDQSIVRA